MALRPPRARGRFRVPEEPYKVNERITAREVRLVGENIEPGIFEIGKARAMAEAQSRNCPYCYATRLQNSRLLKVQIRAEEKAKGNKAKAQKVVIKEIRFGPNTDDHDFDFKLKHAINFLKEGSKVKAYVHFVGRTIVFKERGVDLLKRFSDALSEFGKVEMEPKLEGKRMTIILAPLPPKGK